MLDIYKQFQIYVWENTVMTVAYSKQVCINKTFPKSLYILGWVFYVDIVRYIYTISTICACTNIQTRWLWLKMTKRHYCIDNSGVNYTWSHVSFSRILIILVQIAITYCTMTKIKWPLFELKILLHLAWFMISFEKMWLQIWH